MRGRNCDRYRLENLFRSVTLTRPLERSEFLGGCLDPWAIRWPITFSRNLARDFTQYHSEQPEMSSHDEASKKAKTVEGN